MPAYSLYASVYSLLLDHCVSSPRFARPWDFLAPPPDCYGPVALPDRALAALTAKHPISHLLRCGVVGVGPSGPRLAPRLTKPGAIIIPQRVSAGGPPFALIAGRGCLPAPRDPIWAARRDAWTTERVASGGLLFVGAHIGDVALLRSLDLPATLSGGLRRLGLSAMGHLQGHFPGPDLFDPRPKAAESDRSDSALADDERGGDMFGGPPSLVVIGWSPRTLNARPSPTLAHAARHLTLARRHMRYQFPGIGVWKPSADDIETVRYLMQFRTPGQIALAFRTSADTMYDLDVLAAGPPGKPPSYSQAQAALVAALAAAGPRPLEHLGSRAQTDYDAAVARNLIGPLHAAAQRMQDPIARAGFAQLGDLANLMFAMTPHLKALQARALAAAWAGEEAAPADRVMNQYLHLVHQYMSLSRDAERLRFADL